MIKKRQNEILSSGDQLDPIRAAQILTELSALYGNILDEVKKRQMIYGEKLVEILDTEKSVAKAEAKAKATSEYESLLEAKNTDKLCLELIRSIKYYLRAKEDEMNEAV